MHIQRLISLCDQNTRARLVSVENRLGVKLWAVHKSQDSRSKKKSHPWNVSLENKCRYNTDQHNFVVIKLRILV